MIQIWQVPLECGPSNLVVLGKAHRHYDEGRRGSHFEVGRAMPLARADIFSCSDR